MASLSKADINKRNNIEVFSNRLINLGSFVVGTSENGDMGKITGKVKLTVAGKQLLFDTTKKADAKGIMGAVSAFATDKSAKLEIELEVKRSKKYYSINNLFKDKDFGGVAGKSSGAGSERQELSLIKLINDSVRGGSSYIQDLGGKSNPVSAAMKNDGLSKAGQEPYIDIFVQTKKKKYGVSCKGKTAPSLAGGGLVGLQIVVPDLVKRLYRTILDHMKKDLKLKQGDIINADTIPDLAIEIPKEYIRDILIGNEYMGGPIDYMYIGDMDVKGIRKTSGEIDFTNGKFYNIDQYMQKIDSKLFFRIRKRDLPADNNIQIEYEKKNKSGEPLVWVTPNNTKSHLRIVIVDKATAAYRVLKLKN